jgi:Tol biopolymer transport system component
VAPEVVPLTSYAGSEQSPSFSPDGNQVAFSWNGEKQDNFDIYIKLINSPTPVRLTTDPADDVSPAFSPDGGSIGFFRQTKEGSAFVVFPSIGGPERIVAEAPNLGLFFTLPSFAWFPDGKWVVTHGLALLSIETGEGRRLTIPSTKEFVDVSPAVSPDGHTVAFSRPDRMFEWNIYLLELTEDLKPNGEPRQLTTLKGVSLSPAWTPNGQEIIFTSGASLFRGTLWRVTVSGQGKPDRLPFTGGEPSAPTISRSGNRLAYQRDVSDLNIWRLPLSGSGVAAGAPARFIVSTRVDLSPQDSPDGQHIAFSSNRTGVGGIWVCDADGSTAVELFLQARLSGSPSWSPDGQRVAFDSNLEGNMDIYVIRASGGKPVRLTTDSADDNVPSWSRDGNWIYFTSQRGGRREVWKVPAGGGEAVQVTRNGGFAAFESLDGMSVYYTKGVTEASMALWRMPVSGGEESQVLPSVVWRAFSLVDDRVYFIPDPDADGKSSIQFLTFATGKVKKVASIPGRPDYGLTVSPDRRYLLYTQVDGVGSDLMLLENFR